jgi:hypothetical protein
MQARTKPEIRLLFSLQSILLLGLKVPSRYFAPTARLASVVLMRRSSCRTQTGQKSSVPTHQMEAQV